MNYSEMVALFFIMLALAVIPSTSVMLVVTRSVTSGISNGVAVAAGIVLGDLFFIALAIAGLSALSELMGSFFLVIRYIAAGYLIWFGFSLIKNRHNKPALSRTPLGGGLGLSFLSGLFLTLGDIKAIVFYASLFPAFIEVPSLTVSDIFTIAIITVVAVGGVKVLYAILAKKIAVLGKDIGMEKEAKIASGSLMLGAGTYLLVKT